MKVLRVDCCACVRADIIFWRTGMYFSLITMAGEQVETLEQLFTELAVLVDQTTHHIHSSNLNLWEHLYRRPDDSLNVLNIFLSRCEEFNFNHKH